MIGAHDMIIAATAMSLGWDVLTSNAAEFRQVEGLGVREAGEACAYDAASWLCFLAM